MDATTKLLPEVIVSASADWTVALLDSETSLQLFSGMIADKKEMHCCVQAHHRWHSHR